MGMFDTTSDDPDFAIDFSPVAEILARYSPRQAKEACQASRRLGLRHRSKFIQASSDTSGFISDFEGPFWICCEIYPDGMIVHHIELDGLRTNPIHNAFVVRRGSELRAFRVTDLDQGVSGSLPELVGDTAIMNLVRLMRILRAMQGRGGDQLDDRVDAACVPWPNSALFDRAASSICAWPTVRGCAMWLRRDDVGFAFDGYIHDHVRRELDQLLFLATDGCVETAAADICLWSSALPGSAAPPVRQ